MEGYSERPVGPAMVLWETDGGATTILPDGCLDLIWNGRALIVAGPDATARHHDGDDAPHVGLRFSHGRGPACLGVRADELRDTTVPLDAVWSDAGARELAARAADDPARALTDLAARTTPDDDPFGPRVFTALRRGCGVAGLADALGTTTRTLHRRCRPVFGYGPQHLGRILRLQRALARARAGTPWAEVAAVEGFVDQPHLAREVRALADTTPTELLVR